jgi:hypothetical protein
MKKFEKNYLGKARQVDGLRIIKVTLKVADIVKFAHQYEGEDFISFEVARMQRPDQFGRQYTVYVNSLVEHQQGQSKEVPSKKSTTKRKITVEAENEDEMPL